MAGDSASSAVSPPQLANSSPELQAVLRKVTWRLIPFLFLLYVFAYLDRVNVGFAAAGMQHSLGFSSAVYGAGAGIFFLGYALFEIPSNLLLLRVGPRRWIGGLMLVWGVLSAAMLLVRNAPQFYALRFVLGLSEAGFFPGVILYLTFWFPARERARAVARFMTATAVAGLVGSPVSAAILRWSGGPLQAWQWLFLVEGAPAVLLGFCAMRWLAEGPEQAAWLTPEERALLRGALLPEREQALAEHESSLSSALANRTVWLLGAAYFCLSVSLYTLSLWLPLLTGALRGVGGAGRGGALQIGLLSSLPYLAAVLTMTRIARHSDRRGERRRHVAACLLCGGTGYGMAAAGYGFPSSAAQIWFAVAAFCVIGIGTWGALGPFWAMPAALLRDQARAAGIALINSIGALGGFIGPAMLGWLRGTLGSFRGGLLATAVFPLLGAVAVLLAAERRRAPSVSQKRRLKGSKYKRC